MAEKNLHFMPGAVPFGVAGWASKPSPEKAAALATELNTSGNADDSGTVAAADLAATRLPNAVALANVDGLTRIVGTSLLEFVSFAACTPNTLLIDSLAAVLYARSRSSISFYLGDSGEFAAPSLPASTGKQPKVAAEYGKNMPGLYCGGFGVPLSPKDPNGYPAATEWRVATSLVLHPVAPGQPVVVASPGDLAIWSGWRAQASDFTNPNPAPKPSEQDGYVYWDDAARHAIGIQFFSGDGGIVVAGLGTPGSGSRKIAFVRAGVGASGGGPALTVAADSFGNGSVTLHDGLGYSQRVDVASGQLLIPILQTEPTALTAPGFAGLYVDRDTQRLYVAEAPPIGGGWSGWHYWNLQVLP